MTFEQAYKYLQGRLESLGYHGWAHDMDGEIEAAQSATPASASSERAVPSHKRLCDILQQISRGSLIAEPVVREACKDAYYALRADGGRAKVPEAYGVRNSEGKLHSLTVTRELAERTAKQLNQTLVPLDAADNCNADEERK